VQSVSFGFDNRSIVYSNGSNGNPVPTDELISPDFYVNTLQQCTAFEINAVTGVPTPTFNNCPQPEQGGLTTGATPPNPPSATNPTTTTGSPSGTPTTTVGTAVGESFLDSIIQAIQKFLGWN
jgi:hypothetical protein